MQKTDIEWCSHASNPFRVRRKDGLGRPGWHCQKVSPGCKHCYAEGINRRFGTLLHYTAGNDADLVLDDEAMHREFLAWEKMRQPARIFVCDMTDFFGQFTYITDENRRDAIRAMAACPQHTFMILTKRAEDMRSFFLQWAHDIASGLTRELPGFKFPLPNVWLGVSAENETYYDARINALLKTPAAVRFLSVEPLLGPLNLDFDYLADNDYPLPDWVIVGGESGPSARPMHPAWVRAIRDECARHNVAFFFKQWGAYAPIETPGEDVAYERVGKKRAGALLDGQEHRAYPTPTAA